MVVRQFLVFILFSLFLDQAYAQAIKKAIIRTPTVQCELCKNRIENRLIRDEGITSIKADPKRHVIMVSYIPDRTNIENIKTSIANLGYDADDVTAEPDAYKRLPATCQHVINGKPLK